MTDKPRAPGAMGMMAASLAEQRNNALAKGRAQLEKVFDDDEDDEPAPAPASVVSIESTPAPSPAPVAAPTPAPVTQIKAGKSDDHIYLIDPNDVEPWELADRPDDEFGDLEGLTESIRAHGQETPALLRPIANRKGKYQLIYGRRRWTVCKDLGIKLKAFVRALDDKSAYQKMHLENADRQDLSAWAKACSYKKALDKGLYPSESALAAHLGIHRASLSNIMALNRIPSQVIEAIGPGMAKIGVQAAKAIINVCKDPLNVERVVSMADKIGSGTMGPESIISAVQKVQRSNERETRVITDEAGKKLFSCRVTGRGMTEVMFYPEALKRHTEEELINKIKGLFG